MATEILLPNNWKPRVYQRPLWRYLDGGGRWAYEIAHRRWGKDDVCLNREACAAMERIGNYWHMLPVSTQGRKAIWDAINPHSGKRRIDEAFPHAMRRRTVDDEMKIEFINGSMWQVLGSDNYNSYMGSPPAGVVFSEWALSDPQSWPYIQPILEENGGWAFFITTPRGRNHAKDFYDMAMNDDKWFCERQGADKTGVFTQEQLNNIRMQLIDLFGHHEGEARFMQEYMVSFDAALPGSYYGKEMNDAEAEKRITRVPHDPALLVFPCFDFGRGQSNATSIAYMQMKGYEPRVIDYDEDNSGNIPSFGRLLRSKPYNYGHLILPHDAGPERLATGMSYEEQFKQMGFSTKVLPRTPDLSNDINITRQFITMCWFNEQKCRRLIECLRQYHREWDPKAKIFKSSPKHDWSSHGADAYRQAAIAHKAGLLAYNTDMGYDDDYDLLSSFDEGRSSLTGY